jgi:membrane protein implicated in regulation of membrane protease activity
MMGNWGVWGWLALGFGLIAVEMLIVPGGFPLWIGLAALVMAGVVSLFTLGWQVELIIFGLLAVLASIIAWKLHYRSSRVDAADGMHDRVEQLMGREYVLDQGTEEGAGRIRVDDTVWRVTGPALPAGTRVRIKGADGATLVVERA